MPPVSNGCKFSLLTDCLAVSAHSDHNFTAPRRNFLLHICTFVATTKWNLVINSSLERRRNGRVETKQVVIICIYLSRYLTEKWRFSKRLAINDRRSQITTSIWWIAISFRIENRSARSANGSWKAAWRILKVTLSELAPVNQQSYWHFDIHLRPEFFMQRRTR